MRPRAFPGNVHMARTRDSGTSPSQKTFRVAAVLAYPAHYLMALYRELAKEPEVDLMVYLCSDFGMRRGYDRSFNQSVVWYDDSVLQGVPHRFLPNRSFRDYPEGFWGVMNPSIVGEIRRGGYDAILLNGYTYATNHFAAVAAKLARTRVLVRGESHLKNHRSPVRRAVKRALLPPLFANASAILPIGTLNEAYYRHYGVPERKLFAAPYTVDNAFYRSAADRLAPERAEIRRALGIKENACVILFASKLIERKRPMDLLLAYEKLAANNLVATPYLLFAGDGPEREVLERYAHEHGIRNVSITGFVPPTLLARSYAVADVFVFPSGFETWGLVVNEAMNFGLPVITTDQVGAGCDLVRHGKNGFVYAAGDVDELAEHLATLIADERLRRSMGAASLARISGWSNQEAVAGIMRALRDT